MTIKAVLFDKDGTLLDFDATYARATKAVIADLVQECGGVTANLNTALGYLPDANSFAGDDVVIAGSVGDIANALSPHLKTVPDSLSEKVDELYRHHTRKTVTPFPFTRSTLEQLAAINIKMGIGTNDGAETAREHSEVMGLTSFFHSISGYDSGFGAKPSGGMVSAFVDDLGMKPSDVMMVGDSAHDCLAAAAAGVVTVGVTSGHYNEEILGAVAKHVLPDISALPDLIEKLNGVSS